MPKRLNGNFDTRKLKNYALEQGFQMQLPRILNRNNSDLLEVNSFNPLSEFDSVILADSATPAYELKSEVDAFQSEAKPKQVVRSKAA